MINISKEEFNKLRGENKSFAVSYVTNMHGAKPVNIFSNLKGKMKFLFELSSGKEGEEEYSYMACNPYKTIKSFKDTIIEEMVNLNEKGIVDKTSKALKTLKGTIFDYLKGVINVDYENLNRGLPFDGGAIGYLGYDTAKLDENIEDRNVDKLKVPDSYVMLYEYFLCYDHKNESLSIIYNVLAENKESYEEIIRKILLIESKLYNISDIKEVHDLGENSEISSNLSKLEFGNIVEKAKAYIRKGDIFQVVLSQRFEVKQRYEAFDIYRRLKNKAITPYLFYIDYDDFQIVGASPETLVKVKDGRVYTNPIAGTRKRGRDKEEDLELEEDLMNDEKEKAEHLMLVDLGRNDIGKVSEFGTVRVEEFMKVNYYSHVMHITSTVSGELKNDISSIDALRSCIPVGTVSGAPKIRAMEIIEELENTKRGIYAGAVGYLGYNGNIDSCIAIRTIICKDGYSFVQAGAGIVYDSVPENEYYETVNKAKLLMEVL